MSWEKFIVFLFVPKIIRIFAENRRRQTMEQVKTREEFLERFEAAKQRKRDMVAKMKEEMTIECEKRTGKKPTSFFVL